MHIFRVVYFQLRSEQFVFNCTAILLLFLVVPTASTTFMVLWDDISYSLLIQVFALYYQPSCHNFIQLAIMFK
jgi:hypothetical protein